MSKEGKRVEGMSKNKLTVKQKQFADEYLVDFNATQAAIRAGYSEKTAYSIGWENLRKPEIKEYIKTATEEKVLSAEATKKILSDIANAKLNDYFVIRQVKRSKLIEVPLKKVIKTLEDDMAFEQECANAIGYTDKRLEAFQEEQRYRAENLIRLRLELKKDPKAKRIIPGPEELVEEAELDMVKLTRDKENARIKSVTYGQFGPKVELHDSATALTNIAKIHGIFAPLQQSVTVNKGFFDFLKETSKNND